MLLAHQGGWDESLLVIGPLALLTMLLQVARHRAERERAAEDEAAAEAAAPDQAGTETPGE